MNEPWPHLGGPCTAMRASRRAGAPSCKHRPAPAADKCFCRQGKDQKGSRGSERRGRITRIKKRTKRRERIKRIKRIKRTKRIKRIPPCMVQKGSKRINPTLPLTLPFSTHNFGEKGNLVPFLEKTFFACTLKMA